MFATLGRRWDNCVELARHFIDCKLLAIVPIMLEKTLDLFASSLALLFNGWALFRTIVWPCLSSKRGARLDVTFCWNISDLNSPLISLFWDQECLCCTEWINRNGFVQSFLFINWSIASTVYCSVMNRPSEWLVTDHLLFSWKAGGW